MAECEFLEELRTKCVKCVAMILGGSWPSARYSAEELTLLLCKTWATFSYCFGTNMAYVSAIKEQMDKETFWPLFCSCWSLQWRDTIFVAFYTHKSIWDLTHDILEFGDQQLMPEDWTLTEKCFRQSAINVVIGLYFHAGLICHNAKLLASCFANTMEPASLLKVGSHS